MFGWIYRCVKVIAVWVIYHNLAITIRIILIHVRYYQSWALIIYYGRFLFRRDLITKLLLVKWISIVFFFLRVCVWISYFLHLWQLYDWHCGHWTRTRAFLGVWAKKLWYWTHVVCTVWWIKHLLWNYSRCLLWQIAIPLSWKLTVTISISISQKIMNLNLIHLLFTHLMRQQVDIIRLRTNSTKTSITRFHRISSSKLLLS